MESFNESTVDPNIDGPKYIDTIIEQINGDDPTRSWREFAEEYIFSEQDIKNGSFRRLTPGLIDVSRVWVWFYLESYYIFHVST